MSKKKKITHNNVDRLIPELRFPEFENEGPWAQKPLGEIGNFIGGGTPDTTNDEYWNGDILWFTPTEVKEGYLIDSKRKITDEGLKNSSAKLLPPGALLITTRATIGDIGISTLPCTTNQGFQSLVVSDDQVNLFWYYWLGVNKNELARRSSGSTFPEIGKNEIAQIIASAPLKPEQQKIASCLSSLDEVITAHNQKLELLKEHKKGLMQNLFPQKGEKVPKLRFKEFEKDGEWVEKLLSEVANYENGKAHEQDISVSGNYIVVNSKFISTDGKVAKHSNTAYCLAGIGDILMVMSDVPNGRAIAKCFYVSEDDKYTVNQRICKVTAFECKSLFLFYVMNRNPYFIAFDDGVKQTNLRNDDVLDFQFLIPTDPKEQQKIAACLSSLDELITAQAEKIEQLKLHKKGLMQGLFPTVSDR